MRKNAQSGFTFMELLIVITVIGILASITAPTWLRFFSEQQTIKGRGHIRLSIQSAQLKAQQYNSLWQLSVRQNGDIAEIATHPATVLPSAAVWDPMNKSIRLDTGETTVLYDSGELVYYVRFDEKGNVRESSLGRVTVSSKQFSDIKRCVFVSTLLGATRVAETQVSPDKGGRFCY